LSLAVISLPLRQYSTLQKFVRYQLARIASFRTLRTH
jgi:hypothetical protein